MTNSHRCRALAFVGSAAAIVVFASSMLAQAPSASLPSSAKRTVTVDDLLAMHRPEDGAGHHPDRVGVAAGVDAVLDRLAERAVVEERKAQC